MGWTAIFAGILRIAVWFVDRSAMAAEKKKRFFEWVKKQNEERLSSVKLKKQLDSALKFFEENPWEG